MIILIQQLNIQYLKYWKYNPINWRQVYRKINNIFLINQNMKAGPPQISSEIFFNHVQKLYKVWKENYSEEMDSIFIINGKEQDSNMKTVAVVSWLLGFNFSDTILVFNKKSITIFSSEKKVTYLNVLKQGKGFAQRNITFIIKQKSNQSNFQKLWDLVEQGSKNPKIGMLLKDKKKGETVQQFDNFLKTKSFTQTELSPLLNQCFLIKDGSEIQNIRKASRITIYFLEKLINQIETIIDQEQITKHSTIAQKIEKMIDSQPELRKAEVKLAAYKIKKQFVDIGPPPLIQSGGTYSLKLNSQSNTQNLKSDCILIGLGCQYKVYNSYITRTLMIDPTQQQKKTYQKYLQLQNILISNSKPGIKIKDLYKIGADFIKGQFPDTQIPQNFGYGVGLQYRENSLLINQTNEKILQAGMTLLITCGCKLLKSQSKTYAIQLTDIILIKQGGAQILTQGAQKKLDDISYTYGEQNQPEDKKKQKQQKKQKERKVQEVQPLEGRRRRKQQANNLKLKSHRERIQHQAILKKEKLQELKNRNNQNFAGNSKKIKEIDYEKLQSYKTREQFPKDLKKNKIYVDFKANSILLPVSGSHVPYHITILKNIAKFDQGKYIALRFNFHTPAGGVLANVKLPKFNQNTIFIKQLTYRSQDIKSLTQVLKSVKQLQKKVKTIADEQKNKDEIVDQQKIQLNKGKKPLLRDLQIRPNLNQKKIRGNLECHLNGFRYTAQKGQIIDIIFSNIKSAFIQPCQKQIIAAIHFRLHDPIMIGKKKTEDVQFYSEAGNLAQDIDRIKGRNEQDSDEEERQKASRRKLDKEFLAFAKASEQFMKQNGFQFEVPNREYGFFGTPFRTNSLLQPTKKCLINITQQPFFVLHIEQIQVACFERMFANIRNFDLTFVFKDYQKFLRILSIPIQEVEKIKDWLDRSNIIFYDIQKNIAWSKFLQTIRHDFKKFVQDGGWTAWDSDSQQENQNEQQQGDSAFTVEVDKQEDDEESDDDSESDFTGEDEDSQSYEDQQLSEQGLSSDQMEEKFAEEDKKKIKKEMQKEVFKKKK